MRFAQIQNGRVVNVIEADEAWSSVGGYIQSDTANIGDFVDAPDSITLGKRFIAQSGFEPDDLVTMFDMLLSAKEAGTLDPDSKLVATYAWLQTVKASAKNGLTAFPPAPFTFREVVTE